LLSLSERQWTGISKSQSRWSIPPIAVYLPPDFLGWGSEFRMVYVEFFDSAAEKLRQSSLPGAPAPPRFSTRRFRIKRWSRPSTARQY